MAELVVIFFSLVIKLSNSLWLSLWTFFIVNLLHIYVIIARPESDIDINLARYGSSKLIPLLTIPVGCAFFIMVFLICNICILIVFMIYLNSFIQNIAISFANC